MKLSIDTSAYRALTDGDPEILALMRQARVVGFSVIVLAELRAGFSAGTRTSFNEQILKRTLSSPRVEVHDITEATSSLYAFTWSELKRKGKPIPTNDVWIAATCLQHGFTLLTRDRHFREVEGLQVLP